VIKIVDGCNLKQFKKVRDCDKNTEIRYYRRLSLPSSTADERGLIKHK